MAESKITKPYRMDTIEEFTLTKGSSGTSNWTLNNATAYRIGNICCLELTLTVTSSEGKDTNVTITTLPERMRPPVQLPVRACGAANGADFNFRINTNGTVIVGRNPASTAGTCRMQVTYPVPS